ncbi:MAG: SpoIID/LytB domain-containing protein [Treponema sp.]|nr:SpoIID/LytB domain-containing protein [Treponema sp.]
MPEPPPPVRIPEEAPFPEQSEPEAPDVSPAGTPPSVLIPTVPLEVTQPPPLVVPRQPPPVDLSEPTVPQEEPPAQPPLNPVAVPVSPPVSTVPEGSPVLPDPPAEEPPQILPPAQVASSPPPLADPPPFIPAPQPSVAPEPPPAPVAVPVSPPSQAPAFAPPPSVPSVSRPPAVLPTALPPSRSAPIPPPPRVEQALRSYYQGNVEGSIRDLEQALQQDTHNASILWQLARSYTEIGNGNTAAVLMETLYTDKPADPEVERELFVSLCFAGNYQKAVKLLPLSRETGETLFYEAILRRDTGDTRRAITALRRSLSMENFRPIAWLFLGELLTESAPGEAETCFRTALRQDPELHVALFPLGKVLLAQNRYQEAYESLSRAHQYFPQQDSIIRDLNEVLRRMPELGREQEIPRVQRIITANPPKVKALRSLAQGMPLVRIGLAEGQTSITVKTGGPYVLRLPGEKPLFTGRAPEQLWAEMRNGKLFLLDQGRKTLIIAAEPVVLEYQDPENTTLLSGFTFEDRSYRGSIEFRPEKTGITVINILNIEEYLYGVIPAEMPAYWPVEALKAQAIAARSYTLACLGDSNRDVPKEKGFDVYGSVLSAAYRGVNGEARAATAAVDATRGMYLAAGGNPLKAYYSANHGGYSEDSRSVWGTSTFNAAVPDKLLISRTNPLSLDELARWIRERPRSYASMPDLHSSQAYRWEKWVAAEEIRSRNAADGNNIGEILQVISRGRGISGRINEVEIRGTQGTLRIKGDRIRSRLGGLRSNLFTIRSKLGTNGKPEYFIFQGAGWGHGVGLDQSGAAGMAQAGFTAAQILGHYYPLATLR